MARRKKPLSEEPAAKPESPIITAGFSVRVLERADGTCPFLEWRASVRDMLAKVRISARLARILRDGNLGDHRERIKGAVSELRIDYGPGYRVYYVQVGTMIVVLMGGGTKDSQQADIESAYALWEMSKDENARFSRDFSG